MGLWLETQLYVTDKLAVPFHPHFAEHSKQFEKKSNLMGKIIHGYTTFYCILVYQSIIVIH